MKKAASVDHELKLLSCLANEFTTMMVFKTYKRFTITTRHTHTEQKININVADLVVQLSSFFWLQILWMRMFADGRKETTTTKTN